MKILEVISVLMALLMAKIGYCQDSLNIMHVSDLVDRWSNGTDLAADGDRIYVGTQYDGVWIFDVSNPSQPDYLGRFLVGENIDALTVIRDIAYVKISGSGRYYIAICDVSEPANPNELSRIEIHTIFGSVHDGPVVYNDHLYVGTEFIDGNENIRCLTIWNVSDPTNPQLVNRITDHGALSDLAVNGNLLYGISDFQYLEVFDITRPGEPERLTDSPWIGYYHSIKIFGGYLYTWGNVDPQRYSVFDVSDPNDPNEVWFTESIRQADDMVAIGDYLFVDRDGEEVNGWNQGLAVLDISDPSAPEWVRLYVDNRSLNLTGLATVNGFLYTLSYNYSQLKAMDISNPNELEVTYESLNYGDVKDVDTFGDFTYVTYIGWEGIGLAVYLTMFPDSPELLGTINLIHDAHAPKTTIAGDLLFTSGRGEPFDRGGITICSLADPVNPELIYSRAGDIHEIAVHDPFAYLAQGVDGVKILDISNPRVPVEAATIPVRHYTSRVAVKGNRMLMTDISQRDTVWSVDISNPRNPRKIGFFTYINPIDEINYSGFAITENVLIYGRSIFKFRNMNHPRMEILSQFDPFWSSNVVEMALLNDTLLSRIDVGKGLAVYSLTGNAPLYDSLEVLGYYSFTCVNPRAISFNYPYLFTAGTASVSMYDLRSIFGDTLAVESVKAQNTPPAISLSAFPNPFNSSVTISFSTGSQAAPARLAVHDISGRLVADLLQNSSVTAPSVTEFTADRRGSAEEHKVTWDASSVGAGVYFVRSEAGDEVRTEKIVLMR